jgi:hypothetical protein
MGVRVTGIVIQSLEPKISSLNPPEFFATQYIKSVLLFGDSLQTALFGS